MNELQVELMRAASLLEKAASIVEYNTNLSKEASDTTEDLIAHGLVTGAQRESYTNFLINNPEKIASMKNFIKDLPMGGSGALGEVADFGNTQSGGLDPFDRELMG